MASHAVLWRRNLALMVVLFIVTLGFYYPAWFLRRRPALNRLDSPTKLQLWPYLLLTGYMMLALMLAIAAPEVLSTVGMLIVHWGTVIVMIREAFRIKDILEDHLTPETGAEYVPMLAEPVKLSGVLTFLFSSLYLQQVINTHLDALQPRPAPVSAG